MNSHPRSQQTGVVMIGNLRTLTGVSRMNRLLLEALRTGGFPVLEVPLEDRTGVATAIAELADFRQRFERIVIIASHTVDRLPLLEGFLARPELRGVHRIALWHWEYCEPPAALAESQRLFDEFWAVSRHAAISLQKHRDTPVRVLPVPIPLRTLARPSKPDVGWPDRFTFLTVFDHLSLSPRKNPTAAMRAFREAFPEPLPEGPQLIIKSRSAERMPEADNALRYEAAQRPDITIQDSALTDERQADLIAAADVLVSLHRAEGYGLALAEAMGAGTIAMGTAWSGNLDFMTASNSVLVPYQRVPASADLWNVPAGADWAEPDVSAAATEMQRLVSDQPWRDELRATAFRDAGQRHSFEVTAEWLGRALEV